MEKVILKTGETLHFSVGTTADAAAVIEHLKIVGDETEFLSFSGADFAVAEEEQAVIIEAHQSADNRLFLLAWIKEELVGVLNIDASAKPKMQHLGEIGLSVLRAHWKKGIGYYMIQTALAWARETAILKKVNLEVQENNYGAIRLYEKLGFFHEGARKRGVLTDGVYYDLTMMGICIN
ncbi:MAG: GNAT family N-acetyltransferase [Saprospiraceae bacterium]